jgi:hypothetical protein
MRTTEGGRVKRGRGRWSASLLRTAAVAARRGPPPAGGLCSYACIKQWGLVLHRALDPGLVPHAALDRPMCRASSAALTPEGIIRSSWHASFMALRLRIGGLRAGPTAYTGRPFSKLRSVAAGTHAGAWFRAAAALLPSRPVGGSCLGLSIYKVYIYT